MLRLAGGLEMDRTGQIRRRRRAPPREIVICDAQRLDEGRLSMVLRQFRAGLVIDARGKPEEKETTNTETLRETVRRTPVRYIDLFEVMRLARGTMPSTWATPLWQMVERQGGTTAIAVVVNDARQARMAVHAIKAKGAERGNVREARIPAGGTGLG